MNYTETMQEMFYNERKGKVYGNWEVIDVKFDAERHKQLWTLRCIKCGREKQTYWGKDLVKGKNKGTCRCEARERQRIRQEEQAAARERKNETKVKKTDHVLYSIWKGIKQRCYCETDKDYKNYGARGIKMCDEWKENFWEFVKWGESSGYMRGLTIDRIDNDRGYSPDNCVWADRTTQARRRRNVRTFGGLTIPQFCESVGVRDKYIYALIKRGMSLSEAFNYAMETKSNRDFAEKCRKHGMRVDTVKARMKRGMTFEEAVAHKGTIGKYYFEYNGEKKTLNEWCKLYHITPSAVIYRMNKRGMTFAEALTAPKNKKL